VHLVERDLGRVGDSNLLGVWPDLRLGEALEVLLGFPNVDDADAIVGLRDPVRDRMRGVAPRGVRPMSSRIWSYWSSVAPLKFCSTATGISNVSFRLLEVGRSSQISGRVACPNRPAEGWLLRPSVRAEDLES
jgi:hypothetical protein